MEQPLGFERHDRESHVCRLKKSLYDLKQAPKTWYNKIDSFLSSLGFTKSKADSNLYYNKDILDFLLLFSNNFILQALQHWKMSYREKVGGMRVPLSPP